MKPKVPIRKRTFPVQSRPRRQAGQGLRERITDQRDAFIMYAGGVCVFGAVVLTITWITWLSSPRWTPWNLTVGVLVTMVAVILEGWRRVQRSRRDQLGLFGELATAEWLNQLAAAGYYVFHDLPGEKGNVDHVAVGPAGVFVIETKARSKAPGDQILYDGQRLLVGRWDATEQYLGQARACRDQVKRKLREHSSLLADIPVRAVLAFPGWDVPETRSSGAEVWVLNPKGRIAAWIRQEERFAGVVHPNSVRLAIEMLDNWSRQQPVG